MIEINEVIHIDPTDYRTTHFYVTMAECAHCFSLQPCISGANTYRCVDWHACQQRQRENKEPDAIRLTVADQCGLLELVEIQRETIDRLKRIEAAATSYAQASEAFANTFGPHLPIMQMFSDMESASATLIALVKESK